MLVQRDDHYIESPNYYFFCFFNRGKLAEKRFGHVESLKST